MQVQCQAEVLLLRVQHPLRRTQHNTTTEQHRLGASTVTDSRSHIDEAEHNGRNSMTAAIALCRSPGSHCAALELNSRRSCCRAAHLGAFHQLLRGCGVGAPLEVDQHQRHHLVVLRLLQHHTLPVQALSKVALQTPVTKHTRLSTGHGFGACAVPDRPTRHEQWVLQSATGQEPGACAVQPSCRCQQGRLRTSR